MLVQLVKFESKLTEEEATAQRHQLYEKLTPNPNSSTS